MEETVQCGLRFSGGHFDFSKVSSLQSLLQDFLSSEGRIPGGPIENRNKSQSNLSQEFKQGLKKQENRQISTKIEKLWNKIEKLLLKNQEFTKNDQEILKKN